MMSTHILFVWCTTHQCIVHCGTFPRKVIRYCHCLVSHMQALHLAQSTNDSVGSDLARCNVGMVQGNLEFEQFISRIHGHNV